MARKIIYFSLLLFIGLSSCVKEPFMDGDKDTLNRGVRVSFNLIVPDSKEVETRVGTRSVYENHIGDVYLLVFDEADLFIEVQPANEAQGEYNFIAALTPRSKVSKIYVVANAPVIMQAAKNRWIAATTTLDQVKSDLLKATLQDQTIGGNIKMVPAVPPLVTLEPIKVDRIDKTMTITNEIVMERAIAKVTVSSSVIDFVVFGANMCNAPAQGYVFPGMETQSIARADYWGTDGSGGYSPEYMIRTATNDNPLYCYESPVDNNPSKNSYLIIKAKYKDVDGYYRINFKDKDGGQLALLRNHSYIINVKKVQTAGYRTAAEARINTALNDLTGSDIDIEVSDSYSHDIVSNGQYYLGVENSEFIIYDIQALTQELVTVVNHNAPSTVSRGSAIITAYDAIGRRVAANVVVNNPFATTNNGTVQSSELKIDLPATVVRAEIQLRIGNLNKTIKVVRDIEPLYFGGAIELGADYVSAKVTTPLAWVKFSDNENSEIANGTDHIVKPDAGSKLYLILASNLTIYPGVEDRSTIVYLSRPNESGRTKVKIHQPKYNIFGKEDKAFVDPPYIGTFHRHNQVGERVIVMGSELTESDYWVADVVEGKDFVKMVLGDSDDANIRTSNPGDAEDYPVYNNPLAKTQIIGKGKIVFRVGLKDKIAPNAHRYGLILISHKNGISRIFVRQGDDADYLYRSTDKTLNAWGDGSYARPLTVPISPYNLSDPAKGVGTKSFSGGGKFGDHNLIHLDYNPDSRTTVFDPKKFTEYPTQAGYFFIWSSVNQPSSVAVKDRWNRAVHPFRAGRIFGDDVMQSWPGSLTYDGSYSGNGDRCVPRYGHVNGYSLQGHLFTQVPKEFNVENDPCPYGYRYPKGGKIVQNSYTLYEGNNAIHSEITQSMFYDPKLGSASVDMQAYTLWGYYADGFFDRLAVQSASILPNVVGLSGNKSMVIKGGALNENTTGDDIGYIGVLVFNPFNFASIFYPATGYLDTAGQLNNPGTHMLYATHARFSTNNIGSAQSPISITGRNDSNDSRFATFYILSNQGEIGVPKSVRCVKDTW